MDVKPTTHLQDITDLTVMAPVRPGLVQGAFNACSYVHRLKTVLRVLHAVRQASRESALQRSPFTDSIGRFRSIHFFRFAVVPPAAPAGDWDRHQLLLNVTFDGGWEPYMRLVWGPLGKLLDVIFCSCEGYPLASRCSFDEYVRWVRGHEVPSSFFYADSADTVADMHYLRALEELQHAGRGRQDPDVDAVALAMQEPPATAVPGLYAVTQAIRVLKALAGLRDFFPSDAFVTGPAQGQDQILLRFARDLLADLRSWIEQGMFDPGGPFDNMNAGILHEREWLTWEGPKPALPEERLRFNRAEVQAGIVESYPDAVRHGVLVLARIENVQDAKEKWLAKSPATPDTPDKPTMYRSVAFTCSGLRRLGVPPHWLERLPHEFRAGMEERAGLLGDLRGNHPDNWKRPLPNWPNDAVGGAPIDLSTVHVVMQLRAALDPSEEAYSADGTIPAKRFVDAIHELETKCGLKILHVQPMRTNKPEAGEVAGRDHFGFVDGISQPKIPALPAPPTSFWSDRVKTGDVFLGYANTRGDKPHHVGPPDELLDNGTFLVVRKIAQFPERLDAVVTKAAAQVDPDAKDNARKMLCEDIKGRMMGRYSNGDPMIKPGGPGKNDFLFKDDAAGAQCPHRSHIRRANPRVPLPGQQAPRIVRRGMSYLTPAADAAGTKSRGIVFMAYNSSIAEQFEVIQRWLAGGNSSGLSSAHDDPFVGVPEIGQRRIYRYVRNGKVMNVDLGEAPLTELQWGVYAFVPSLTGLELLAKPSIDDVKNGDAKPEKDPEGVEAWRALLEDENVRARTWARARVLRKEQGELMNAKDYGLLVSTQEDVVHALRDGGRELSVCGYGKRMADSGIGLGYLGLDDTGPHAGHEKQAPGVNAAIEAITEDQAFEEAFGVAKDLLARALAGYAAATGVGKGPLDVIEYGRRVLSSLCTLWFGLPDERLMHHGTKADDQAGGDKTRCPGHFLTVSRYVFGPHPTPAVEMPAMLHGKRLLAAVRAMLDEAGPSQANLKPLVKGIANAKGIDGDRELAARTVAGVMLGFPPTVLGNLVTVLMKWIASRKLWELQVDLPADNAKARAALHGEFLEAMKEDPVPYAVWRTANTTPPPPDGKVIVGLGSAMADGGDPILMFGGSRDEGSALHAPHACPGYGMAMGVMLGSVAALLRGAALAPTPDPRTLILTALKPPAPPSGANAAGAAQAHSPGSTPFAMS